MSTPEALRIADAIERDGLMVASSVIFDDAPAELRRQRAEIESLTAERDALREAGRLTLAWFQAENDHTGTTFWERVEMCRQAEDALRAALQQPKEQSNG